MAYISRNPFYTRRDFEDFIGRQNGRQNRRQDVKEKEIETKPATKPTTKLTKRGKFPIKTGIEFTFVAKNSFRYYSDEYRILEHKFANLPGLEWAKRNLHSCGGAVEIPTDPLNYMSDAVSCFEKLNSIAKDFGLTGFTRTLGGGGCHMHLNLSNFSEKQMRIIIKNVYTYMTDRPWLAWGFLDPADDVSSRSMLSGINKFHRSSHHDCISLAGSKGSHDSKNSAIKEALFDKMIRTRSSKLPKSLNEYELAYYYPLKESAKEFVLRYNSDTEDKSKDTQSKTLEFRFFDMPSTSEELEFNISVAHAIFTKCSTFDKWYHDELQLFPFSKMTSTKMKNISAVQAIKNFNASIIELKLTDKFRELHHTNIKQRIKLQKQFKRSNYLS